MEQNVSSMPNVPERDVQSAEATALGDEPSGASTRSETSGVSSVPDRRIHARAGYKATGGLWEEIVRYERAGKWYLEVEGLRQAVTVSDAAHRAVELEDQGGEVIEGVPGGTTFYSLVRTYRARR